MKHSNINIAYKLSTQPKNQKIYSNLSLLISPSPSFPLPLRDVDGFLN